MNKFCFYGVACLGFFSLIFISNIVVAEPTVNDIQITMVRPYNDLTRAGSGSVYIYTDRVSLCDANMYRIDLSAPGSNALVAVATAALMGDKLVAIEIDNAGCATPGWQTKIQSIYLKK